jgi:hypothetical protein
LLELSAPSAISMSDKAASAPKRFHQAVEATAWKNEAHFYPASDCCRFAGYNFSKRRVRKPATLKSAT